MDVQDHLLRTCSIREKSGMDYGLSVPELHASEGIRRIIALAYLLAWSWEEHKKACKNLDQKTAAQVVLLIDEIEAHRHPKPPQTSSPSWRITRKCLKDVFRKSLPALDSKRLQFQAVPAEIGAILSCVMFDSLLQMDKIAH